MPRAFCIVDPSLKDFVGHHFEYDRSVAAAAAAAGYLPRVLGHREVRPDIRAVLPVEPAFRRDIWGRHPKARRPGGLADYLRCNLDHLADLRAALRGAPLPPGSVLFAHMITPKQLFGLALQVLATPAACGIETILLLRYQPRMYATRAGSAALRLIEWAARHGRRVRLASDNARLASRLGRLTRLPVEVLPIPHAYPAGWAPAHPAIPPRRPGWLRFVSLGNARDEKGFLEILAAIRAMATAPGGLAGLEFVLQANDPDNRVGAAIRAFAGDLPEGVILLDQALPSAAYHALLASADVVLVPYWQSIYEARTSGVFLEAVAAGKPVIATRDTWMADELAAHGAGLLIEDRSVSDLIRAIREVTREHVRMAAAAAGGAAACLRAHNAEILIARAIAPVQAAAQIG
jgi:glycosyltransferase involved in cell wall biosynthesis